MSALFSRNKKDEKETKQDAPAAVAEKKSRSATSASSARGGSGQAKKAAAKKGTREDIAYRVLITPHVTEKAGRLQGMNQYVFRVHPRAGKQEIAQAIAERFGVHPTRVNTVKIAGKKRRLGRTEGFVSGYKKAVITLPEGKTIDIIGQ